MISSWSTCHKILHILMFITSFEEQNITYRSCSNLRIHLSAPAQDKTIERLMLLSDVKGVISATNKEMKPMFDEQAKMILKDAFDSEQLNAKQLVAADKISALMAKMTSDITEDPKFYDMLKSSFQNTFTEEEALANIAFLDTPLGQSINKKSVQVMSDVMKQSQVLAEQMLQDPKKKAQFMEDFKKIMEPLIEEENK